VGDQGEALTAELEPLEQLAVDWSAYAGISKAIPRLVDRRRLPTHHVAELERTWAQVLDLLWSVRPGARPRVLLGAQDQDGVRDRHGLATVYPGSRGPRAVTGVDDADRARVAANRLGLPPVVQVRSPLTGEVVRIEPAAVIARFVAALGLILPDLPPKQRLERAADKFPPTTGPPARDGTRPIGILPPGDVQGRYVMAYRQANPETMGRLRPRKTTALDAQLALEAHLRAHGRPTSADPAEPRSTLGRRRSRTR
jgi:hypothetical protein